MKLKKEDYKKTTYPDGSVSYDYTCKGNTYYIRVVGYGVDRTMFVYKNDEFETNLQNVFSTKDNLLAWEEFERQVNACSDKPQSSGGFKKNPQANPFALPLLAFAFDGNEWKVNFFIQVDVAQTNTTSQQVSLMDFTLQKNEFTLPIGSGINDVNWTNLNVPDIFKCEIMLKKFDKVVFESDPRAEVFLFIPKTIVPPQPPDDGGEEGEPKEGEPKDGKPKDGKPKDGKPKDGKPKDGEPKDGKPKDGKTSGGKPKDDEPPKYNTKEPPQDGKEPPDDGREPPDDGREPPDGEPKDGKPKDGEPKDGKEPPDDGREPPDDGREPPDGEPKDGKPKDGEPKDGKPKDGEPKDGKPKDGEPKDGKPKDDEPKDGKTKDGQTKPKKDEKPIIKSNDLLQQVADSIGKSKSVIQSFFSRPKSGEIFLLSENFEKIKGDLQLPSNTSALQLSEKINQQLQ